MVVIVLFPGSGAQRSDPIPRQFPRPHQDFPGSSPCGSLRNKPSFSHKVGQITIGTMLINGVCGDPPRAPRHISRAVSADPHSAATTKLSIIECLHPASALYGVAHLLMGHGGLSVLTQCCSGQLTARSCAFPSAPPSLHYLSVPWIIR